MGLLVFRLCSLELSIQFLILGLRHIALFFKQSSPKLHMVSVRGGGMDHADSTISIPPFQVKWWNEYGGIHIRSLVDPTAGANFSAPE